MDKQRELAIVGCVLPRWPKVPIDVQQETPFVLLEKMGLESK